MPTRPSRRERRRKERHNARNLTATASSSQSVAPATTTDHPLPTAFMRAEPTVRKIMRHILVQKDYVNGSVFGIEAYMRAVEATKVDPGYPNYENYRIQVMAFQIIVDYHDSTLKRIHSIGKLYAKQITMWGLECSKPQEEWDEAFIWRRKLEIATLDNRTKKLATEFHDTVDMLMRHKHLYETERERNYVLEALDRFRNNFTTSLEDAYVLTGMSLQR